jgi:thiol-disulfide isomerase/thioredoxin
MNKNRVVQGVALLVSMLFSTGCIQKQPEQEAPKPQLNGQVVYQEPITTPVPNLVIECSDDRVDENNCDRGTISPKELKTKPVDNQIHSLTSIRGKQINISEQATGFIFNQYPGKVIILEMFGKNCPHCIKEIPIIRQIRKRYQGKLEVIAIQAQETMSKTEARNYINRHRIKYPIIEGSGATDLQYFIQNTYGWTGILPYTLVIKDGITEFAYPGEVSFSELRKDIDTLF